MFCKRPIIRTTMTSLSSIAMKLTVNPNFNEPLVTFHVAFTEYYIPNLLFTLETNRIIGAVERLSGGCLTCKVNTPEIPSLIYVMAATVIVFTMTLLERTKAQQKDRKFEKRNWMHRLSKSWKSYS